MSADYDFALSGPAARALLTQSAAIRRNTISLLEALAKDPFRGADFKELSDSGRCYSVLLDQDVIVTYWVDHGAREVRVVGLEWV